MGNAVFRITDGTPAGTVDFIGGPLYILDWIQDIPGYKGGGVFLDSPLSHGRRLAFTRYENTTERIDFRSRNQDGDSSRQTLSRLLGLIKQAEKHWTSNGVEPPVWLEQRSTRETNLRYSTIVTGRLTGLANPFAQPYLQSDGYVVEANLSLLIERTFWQQNEPGSTSALPLVENTSSVNFIKNSDMEDSISLAWTDRNTNVVSTYTTTYAYHGDYSIELEATVSTPGGVYQDISNLDVGSSVTVTAYAIADQGTAKLAIYDGGGFTNAVTDTTTSGLWTQLSVTKTVPAGGSIRVSLEPNSTNDLVYFDLVQMALVYGKAGDDTTGKVYVLNKRGENHITHVYVYDVGTGFGSNLLDGPVPYNLLPSSPQVGDALYIGCTDDFGSFGGPFSNVVFNLSSAADVTINWQYSLGGVSFADLDFVDNTESFSVTGENILTFASPNAWGATTNGGALPSAHWIAGVVTAVGGSSLPTQQTDHIFTVANEYVEIDGLNLASDEPPVVDLSVINEGGAEASFGLFPVLVGTDDARWVDSGAGAGVNSNATETMTNDRTFLVRFQDVTVPKDAIIELAFVLALSDDNSVGDPAVIGVAMENTDDSAAFTISSYEPGLRTFFDFKEWSISSSLWDTFENYQRATPELTDQVQQIVNKANWVSGNAMTVRLTDVSIAGGVNRSFSMYEDDASAWGLVIKWVRDGVPVSKIVAGSRKTSRGSEFRSVLSSATYQRDGVVVTFGQNSQNYPYVSGADFANWDYAARVRTTATESAGLKDRVIWTIPSAMSTSFTGKFRLFLRVYSDFAMSRASRPSVRMRIAQGGSSYYTQDIRYPGLSQKPEILDFGQISFPELVSGEDATTIQIAAQVSIPSGYDFYIKDVVLIPADEWIFEARAPFDRTGHSMLNKGETLAIKSTDSAGEVLVRKTSTNGRTTAWSSTGNLFLPEESETVRVWFLMLTDEIPLYARPGVLDGRSSWTNQLISVTASAQKRFAFVPE